MRLQLGYALSSITMLMRSCIAHLTIQVLGLHLSQHSDWMR